MKRPLGITLIGYFYIFGAIVLLLTLVTKDNIGMNLRFAVPFLPDIVVKIFIALFSLVMAYGYLSLKKWGYWTMMVYSVLFLTISSRLLNQYHSQPYLGNVIFSLIVIVYTFIKRHSYPNRIIAS